MVNQDNKKKVIVEFHDDSNGSVTTVEVDDGTLITDAATKAGVAIPTLCHHPRLNPVGRCGVCVCSVENGPTPTQLACSTYCKSNSSGVTEEKDGLVDPDEELDLSHRVVTADMKVHVNGTDLNGLASAALKRNTAYSQQRSRNFASCGGAGTTEIEDLVDLIKTKNVDISSNSITYEPSLCVGCSRCVRACDQLQGMNVLEIPPLLSQQQPATGIAQPPPCVTTKAGRPLKFTDCIACGQCSVFCPTGAIKEVDHTSKVIKALDDKDMVVVLQTAPSTRVTISEIFGGQAGDCSDKRLVGAAKACGFQYVFDTLVGADLTIVEEAHELLERITIANTGTDAEKKKKPLPMFTSCCPGWINLVEQSYPKLIPHLSSCRSPLGMLSSVIRHHWWPKHSTVDNPAGGEADQSKLFVVAVMPCTAKKDEIAREQFKMSNGKPETDAVLTVRELGRLIELRGVAQLKNNSSFLKIQESEYDNPFGDSTGAAAIFGVTGGVMEAALRTAADVLSGKNLAEVKYESVRGLLGIKNSTVKLGKNDEIALNVAVCHQMANVREFISQIENGNKSNYHFVEVMSCLAGCIGGGGMPQSKDPNILNKRINGLYSIDERMVKRKSHDNEDVKGLYRDVLDKPLSDISHKLLHTRYFARPRKPIPSRKVPRRPSIDYSHSQADRSSTITIVYGTQGGTTKQAAEELKSEMKKLLRGSNQEINFSTLAGNDHPPEKLVKKLKTSFLSIFVTCTFGDGGFPDQLQNFWQHLNTPSVCKANTFEAMKYTVFGLGSTMYAGFEEEMFNRAAKQLDCKLEELGGDRIAPIGLGDDMDRNHYRDGFDKWTETLFPYLNSEIERAELEAFIVNESKEDVEPFPAEVDGSSERVFL